MMPQTPYNQLFAPERLNEIFPEDRADRFFEALLGDVEDGTYDIRLIFEGSDRRHLNFSFHLIERPGKCLVCSRTYGLPDVFRRHPIIDLDGVVAAIDQTLNGTARCGPWRLERTREISRGLHAIPLVIELQTAD